MPLRPTVSSIGTVTYETSKELARILKPLVGTSPHHVQNTQDFLEQIKGIQLHPDQCMMFYKEDQELQHRTPMSVDNIIGLLEFCLNSTYFMFQGKYFEQVEGASMGSPISPIVANLYMENF